MFGPGKPSELPQGVLMEAPPIGVPEGEWTWQQSRIDQWAFGRLVRGIVRDYKAEVYFCNDSWHWRVMRTSQDGFDQFGSRARFEFAVMEAERAMGIQE